VLNLELPSYLRRRWPSFLFGD